VLQVLARSAELAGGTLRSEVRDVVANDEHAIALLTQRAARAGKQFTDDAVAVYRIRDGKVAEIWLYAADQYAADEFFS
jgi:ketosteroid isomerase-like protein